VARLAVDCRPTKAERTDVVHQGEIGGLNVRKAKAGRWPTSVWLWAQ
jgi:hypothetical protein